MKIFRSLGGFVVGGLIISSLGCGSSGGSATTTLAPTTTTIHTTTTTIRSTTTTHLSSTTTAVATTTTTHRSSTTTSTSSTTTTTFDWGIYYPLVINQTATYNYIDTALGTIEGLSTREYTSQSSSSYEGIYIIPFGSANITVSKDATGVIFIFQDNSLSFPPGTADKQLQFPVVVGESWEASGNYFGFVFTGEVLSTTEVVTVEAGTFTRVIKTTENGYGSSDFGVGEYDNTYWYAANVGIVRWDYIISTDSYFEAGTQELKSVTTP